MTAEEIRDTRRELEQRIKENVIRALDEERDQEFKILHSRYLVSYSEEKLIPLNPDPKYPETGYTMCLSSCFTYFRNMSGKILRVNGMRVKRPPVVVLR